MKEIIDKIIETELEAQKQGQRLEEQEAAFQKELEKQVEALKQEKLLRAEKRIEKVQEAEAKISSEQINKVEKKYNDKMQKLENMFLENRDRYLNELFLKMTGGEDHA